MSKLYAIFIPVFTTILVTLFIIFNYDESNKDNTNQKKILVIVGIILFFIGIILFYIII